MKRKTVSKYLVGDFETTVYEGQESTEVWASAVVEMYTEDVKIFHSIEETYDYLISLDCNVVIYYHNLKFDGSFWLSYLMCNLEYKQAVIHKSENETNVKFVYEKDMKNKTFKYSISDMGQWYSITIKENNHIIEIRDSLKLLPFSVKRIGESFATKHKKLDMEYTGFRYAGCLITDEEQKYIANDVLVVKEALEIMFNEGHKKLTIGSCCLDEYKNLISWQEYKEMFPNVYDIKIDKDKYGCDNAGEYIRRSYKGGWCYLVKGKENKILENGITADVNSLYPSMMSSESGNKYPIGTPTFWYGNYIPKWCLDGNHYYFVRIKTRFYLKSNKLPCIQIKHNFMYGSNQWLETSDVYNLKDGKYYQYYRDTQGNLQKATVILTLTMTDFELIKEHYDLIDFEILDGCYFSSMCGIFDRYIDKYKKIKLESKGAKRELAKLFLNNLYGKMASSTNSSFKYAFVKEDKSIGFVEVEEFDKNAGYIPVGSAITSYARNFTIRAAQKNYYGADKDGFIYADTDSIHCNLKAEDLKGIQVHSKDFCCWKLEASWDKAIFARQKTYIERVIAENLTPIEKPYYNIKCAGMPENCKELLMDSMLQLTPEQWQIQFPDKWNEMTQEEQEFVSVPRTMTDFKVGLTVPSKLMPKRIQGGVLLVKTTYEMR
ncbi:MAG: hypothetical protein J6T10_30625 [Methanobrevibacter sp.]|nr:hypothetical protein [Methanobrevibacter sp.]